MLGYSAHKEQAIWVQTVKSQEVQFAYRLAKTNDPWQYTEAQKTKNKSAFVYEQTIGNLMPAKRYEYRVVLDHKMQKNIGAQEFETQTNWAYRIAPPEFSFALGQIALASPMAATIKFFRALHKHSLISCCGSEITYILESLT